jgi:hypothetical protein
MFEDLRLRVAPFSALALFTVGIIAFRAMSAQAPALQSDLLVEGITGDRRLSNLADMYDKGGYLFQQGYGYVTSDALSFPGIEGPDEVAPIATAAARFTRAKDLLAESLRHDPANAHAWLAYAQALATSGDLEGARAALVTSWDLAPTTSRIALNRMFMIQTIRELTDDPSAHDKIYDSDRTVLTIHRPRVLETIDAR